MVNKIEYSIVDVESQTLNLTSIEVRIPGFFLENVEVSSQNTNLSNQSEVNKDTITQRKVADNTKIFIID